MGDFILTYDQGGESYYERVIGLNIILFVLGAIVVIALMLPPVMFVVIGIILTLTTVASILYYLYMNPPRESPTEPEFIAEEA